MRSLRGGKLIAVAFACVLSAACAGCDPYPDPPSDCATIRAQIEANNEQAEKLAEQNHAKIAQNVAAGVVVVWPDSFAMDARSAAGAEMDALKTRQQYLAIAGRAALRATGRSPSAASSLAAASLEHDPEKWNPVFRKDHAQTKSWSGMPIEP